MFMVFRTRLYFAWYLAECMCISSTLGCYPIKSKPRCGNGPTDFEELEKWYVFELISTFILDHL